MVPFGPGGWEVKIYFTYFTYIILNHTVKFNDKTRKCHLEGHSRTTLHPASLLQNQILCLLHTRPTPAPRPRPRVIQQRTISQLRRGSPQQKRRVTDQVGEGFNRQRTGTKWGILHQCSRRPSEQGRRSQTFITKDQEDALDVWRNDEVERKERVRNAVSPDGTVI